MKNFILATILLLNGIAGCVTTQLNHPKSARESFTDGHLNFEKWGRTKECCVAQGKNVAIASGGSHSSECGKKVLENGGNLVDAAVGTAFCLAVERPHSVSIAGGGFMLLHLPKSKEKDIFLDFRETAPAAASKDMFLSKGEVVPDLNRNGALSVATPGFVVGLYDVQRKYGKLKGQAGWAKVLQPSIELARNGFKIYPSLAEKIEIRKDILAKDDGLKKLFLPNGTPLKSGDNLIETELAVSLTQIAKDGSKPIYSGDIGKKIVAHIKKEGGILSFSDLKNYRVHYRSPLAGTFRNLKILTAPPPSSGGILILQSLKTLEGMPFSADLPNTEYLHLLTEVFKRSFADRYLNMSDPDFNKPDPSIRLQNDYIAKIRATIKTESARPASDIKAGEGLLNESPDTTQLSLMDSEGNAVSATITMNYFFGSGLMVPGTGIILNDEMGDFSPKDDGSINFSLPNHRPLSNMAPTIVLNGERPVLVLGAAGGPYIATGIVQVILNRFLLDWTLRDAMFAPRLHHQWKPDKLFLEPNGFSPELIKSLQAKGQMMDVPTLYSQIQAVQSDGNTLTGVNDPRDEGGVVVK